jgi:hypothetical protein
MRANALGVQSFPKQGRLVESVEFERTVFPVCSIGGVPFRAEIWVDMAPGERLVEFCSLTRALDSLTGRELAIEDVPGAVFGMLDGMGIYSADIVVRAESPNHLPVTVRYSYRNRG